jgi:hypothetical protein
LIGGKNVCSEIERAYVIEDVRDYFSEIVRAGDLVALSHPRVLGPKAQAERVVEVIYRAEARVQIDGYAYSDPFSLMEAHRTSKWGVGTRKQTRGRPRKFDPPITEEQITDILSKWHNPAKLGRAGGYTQAQCAEYASALVGQDVTVANIKTLAKERVGHVRRYIRKKRD